MTSDDIIDMIDHAIADEDVSPDAVRIRPEATLAEIASEAREPGLYAGGQWSYHVVDEVDWAVTFADENYVYFSVSGGRGIFRWSS